MDVDNSIKLIFVTSESLNPYENQSLEVALLKLCVENVVILYLWRNENTVVIGRNQNSLKECRVELLLNDGGFLARRISGGGAVYHDAGNLNFTFLATNTLYDVEKHTEIILNAVKSFDISAEKSGRNDIVIGGKKFSGNAFFRGKEASLHHGTILINASLENASKYLKVDREKLKANGVDSVVSRITNLKEHNENITLEKLSEALFDACEAAYGAKGALLKSSELNALSGSNAFVSDYNEAFKKFSNEQWQVGKFLNGDVTLNGRFSWGGVEIIFSVSDEKISDCVVFSDSLDEKSIEMLPHIFIGVRFGVFEIQEALKKFKSDKNVHDDILSLVKEAL